MEHQYSQNIQDGLSSSYMTEKATLVLIIYAVALEPWKNYKTR